MDFLAFHIPSPGRIELVPVSDHSELADDAIEGPMIVTAVSPGTELNSAFANHNPTKPPSITGYASVLRVERVGAKADAKVGELRFCMTNHCSRARYPAAATILVPPGVDAVSASLARLVGVSWTTLTTTAARPPEWVAVTGLGIIGNFAAQMFAAAGYRVLACDPLAARREHLAGRGIELCERLPIDDPMWTEKIAMLVDCSGHEGAALDGCRMVRKGGEVVLVGVPWKRRTDLQAFDVMHAVFHRYVRLRSGWEWEVLQEAQEFHHSSLRENITAAMEWLASGRIQHNGIVLHANPREVQQVYNDLQAQRGNNLTAVFDWSKL